VVRESTERTIAIIHAMGVEVGAIRLLSLASQCGVDFSQTLLLGRQSLHANRADLSRAMTECGVPYGDDIIQSDGYADSFFRALGARTLRAMDASTYEGADIVHDLNRPIPAELEEQFTFVFDGGTTEHVFNFPVAIENAMRMLEVGGHFIGVTICNNFAGHGFYQFSPELFFRVFSPANGFRVRGVYVFESRQAGLDDGIMLRVVDPAELRRRVLLRNSQETFVAVWAERTGRVPIFAEPPQQSDYVESWDVNEGNARAPAATSFKERSRPIRYALKRNLRRATAWAAIRDRPSLDSEGFRAIRMDSSAIPLLMGEVAAQ